MAVVKVIEVVGNSTASWEDAARNALAEAARTVRGITGIEVVGWTATVADGQIKEYRADVKIAFVVESGGQIS
jgi:hypothetical protein